MLYFLFERKMKDDLSQEIHGSFAKKIRDDLLQKKIQLKVTEIVDRILEIVPTTLFTFMETFIGVFIYCFPVKKNQAT